MATEMATRPREIAPADAGSPAGQGDYVVQPGDCMQSIAYEHGFVWKTLWSLPENAELKRRRDPNVLLPGDRVTIPEIRLREEARPTDQRHRFRLLGAPSLFRLRFLDDKQQPRSGVAYVLTIDGQVTSGSLDAAGSLTVPIRPNASSGAIRLQTDPGPESYPLNFGHLDPDSSPTGIRGRLNNLGFPCATDGDWDEDLKGAILRFQIANNMPPTGQLDDQTRQALKQVHQS
jgi:hypothetical protein